MEKTKTRTRTSPQKLSKGKGAKASEEQVKVIFQEDDNEVTVQIDGIEKEFPLPSEIAEEQTAYENNNSNHLEQDKDSEVQFSIHKRKETRSPRVEKFWKEVQRASINFDADGGDLDERQTSREEGEPSSDDDDNASNSSSVKILPRDKGANRTRGKGIPGGL